MEHETITLSRHATAVATPEPTVVMQPAGGAVAIAQETAAERKPPNAVAARPGPAQPPELELLGNQIAELSARIDAATYELLCHLHEFDLRHGWEGWRSCAHWLNWRTGLDLGAAREKLRVAAALADLNHVAAAMARGQLSYSKVRALTRVASPATEARLLAVALSATAAQVERLVRAWRRVDRDAQPDAEQVLLASRALSMQVDEDGMVVLRGRLPPEVGALLLRAVEAAMEQVPASADGGEPTIAQRRADALGLVAESALAGGLDPGNPADRFQVTVHVQADALPARDPAAAAPHVSAETRAVSLTPSAALAPAASLVAAHSARERTGGGRADRAAGPGVAAESARSPRGTSGIESRSADAAGWLPLCEESAPRPRDAKDPNHQEDRSTGIACRASRSEQATIAAPHISAETFEVSEAAFERVAPETDLDAGLAVIEQAGGLHLGREAARRVACDAGLVVLRHAADGQVLDVGRRTRTVPSAMRRALLSRDHGQCQFPGCESRHCDAHHVEHWADGGETRLQNLVLACRYHHRALHEGGFRVVPADTAVPVPAPGRHTVAGRAANAKLGRGAAGAHRRAAGGSRHRHRPAHRHAGVVRGVARPDGGAGRAVGAAGRGRAAANTKRPSSV